MKEVTYGNFGLLIAYLLPGFTTLWGLSFLSDTIRSWLGTPPTNVPTIGGFLYVMVASVAAGLTVSTIRWIFIDSIHHSTGILQPNWDFSKLQQNIDGYDRLIEIHYRYYQFYANTLVALVIAYAARRLSLGFWTTPIGWPDFVFAMLLLIFYAGSRDTLAKFYSRTSQLFEIVAAGECHSAESDGDSETAGSRSESAAESSA